MRWLSLNPLCLHHRLILFKLFCDTSLKVSAAYPCLPLVCLGAVTIDTGAKSSANPCRSLGILSLVYSSNSLTTRFHMKGENPSLPAESLFLCYMQDTFARARTWLSARATIRYLVYKSLWSFARPAVLRLSAGCGS